MSYSKIETFRNKNNNCPVDFTKLQEGLRTTDVMQAKGYKQLGMTDIDGVVEYKGYVLFTEWKGTRDLPTGQRLTLEALSKNSPKQDCMQVYGETDTMKVYAYRKCKNGIWEKWVECPEGLDDYLDALSAWCDHVQEQTSKH
ncbi:hypothetical protein [Phyllobacterium sp. SB3]|uniref:hypothetical protein n=1 Tax=Phyllobacterium sp. SB3 TaxID=3156073 RepID=UPI0032AF8B63